MNVIDCVRPIVCRERERERERESESERADCLQGVVSSGDSIEV